MSEPWTENDTGKEIADGPAGAQGGPAIGFTWRYNRVSHVFYAAFADGTLLKYDASASVLTETYLDGTVRSYDCKAHKYSVALCQGGEYTATANNATIKVDPSGNMIAQSAPGGVVIVDSQGGVTNVLGGVVNVNGAEVVIAGGGPPVARVGDLTVCPAGTGHIASGSSKVTSG